jgi:AcrR family transcriptional regulator
MLQSSERKDVVDARVLRSKAKIREAFVNLLQNQELKDVRVQDVSVLSGVGYSTFYRHYATREDLIAEIAEFEVTGLFEVSYPALRAGPSSIAVCRFFARHIDERRHLWTALTSSMAAPILRRTLIAGMLRASGNAEIGSGFLPRDFSASMAGSIMVELLTWWLRQKEYPSVDFLAEAIDRMIVKPAFYCW